MTDFRRRRSRSCAKPLRRNGVAAPDRAAIQTTIFAGRARRPRAAPVACPIRINGFAKACSNSSSTRWDGIKRATRLLDGLYFRQFSTVTCRRFIQPTICVGGASQALRFVFTRWPIHSPPLLATLNDSVTLDLMRRSLIGSQISNISTIPITLDISDLLGRVPDDRLLPPSLTCATHFGDGEAPRSARPVD